MQSGREIDYGYFPPPKLRKKVVVAGGGPAGMEAARTSAERGHDVILLEKSDQLGGLICEASSAPFKADLKKYLDWSVRMTGHYDNIDIRLSTEATPELIEEVNPDALIIAVGAVPNIPRLSCTDKSKVLWVGVIQEKKVLMLAAKS